MALWTPAELAAPPVGWWDAQDSSTFTMDNGQVAAWRSKVGNINATQSESWRRPVPINGINGRQVLHFKGSEGDALYYTPPTTFPYGNKDFCIAAMVTSVNASLYYNMLMSFGPFANGNIRYICDNAGEIYGGMGNSSLTIKNGTSGTDPRPIVFQGQASTKTMRLTNRGLPPVDRVIANAFGGTAGQGRIGEGADYGGNWDGYIGELMVIPAYLSDADRQKLEGYLAWRWGTEAGLPADHPYRNAQPESSGTPVDPEPEPEPEPVTRKPQRLFHALP